MTAKSKGKTKKQNQDPPGKAMARTIHHCSLPRGRALKRLAGGAMICEAAFGAVAKW
jgi:hypothetical protein